jgi:HAE1 family hydrophobic/amphiphilic exporter-1
MARAVIGGLITSTLLTLVVVPVVYSLLDDLGGWIVRRRRAAAPAAVTTVTLIALCALPVSVARAQAPAAPASGARVVTLQEAIDIASKQNHDIARTRQFADWVHGRYIEERAAALPTVTFTGTTLRQFDDTQSKLFQGFSGFGTENGAGMGGLGEIFGGRQDVRVGELRITQPIFTWGQVGAGIRAARVGYKLADAQLRQSQQTVTRDVATAYYDIVVAKQLVAIAEEDLAQKQRHLAETEKKSTAGAATDYDILSARVAADNARPALIRAQNGVRAAKERLRFLLAAGGDEIEVAPVPAVVVEAPPAYEAVLQLALRNRPELSQLADQRAIYRELVTVAQAASRPRIDFVAGVGKRSLGLPSISSTGTTWNATVFATVPVFDGMRTKGRVAQARIDLSRAAEDEAKARDGITLEVRTAVDAVREAGEILNALAGTVQQAERLLFLSEKGYELGVKTHLEVQDAQLNLMLAKGNLARAERDYRVARVNLDWVSGTLDASTLIP